MKRATIKDVARMAKVSLVTVSRVVNEPARVRADTRERVLGAMRELGYSPNLAAQSMRTNLTRSIGFLTPELSSPTNAAVAQAAQQALAEAGYTMLVTSSNYRPEREVIALALLRARRVDGIILYVSDEEDPASIEAVKNCGVPMVLLDRNLPVEADVVLSDHATALNHAVNYLVGLGHRRIALVQRDLRVRPAMERQRAFVSAVTSARLPRTRVLRVPLRSGVLQALPEDLFVAADAPTALIVEGVPLLRAVLQGCRQYELQIPADRSIIGVDTVEMSSLTTPETTTIARDFDAIGRHAAELMLRRLAAGDAPFQRIMLNGEILLKGSCAAPVEMGKPKSARRS